MAAVVVTEPDYGSDVAGIRVAATPTDGGWVINGVKTWCTFAGRADVLMVLARTESGTTDHKGLSVFIVEKPRGDGHGFEHLQNGGGKMTGRAIDTLGYRGMHSYEVAFEDWFVPRRTSSARRPVGAGASTTRCRGSRTADSRPPPARGGHAGCLRGQGLRRVAGGFEQPISEISSPRRSWVGWR